MTRKNIFKVFAKKKSVKRFIWHNGYYLIWQIIRTQKKAINASFVLDLVFFWDASSAKKNRDKLLKQETSVFISIDFELQDYFYS